MKTVLLIDGGYLRGCAKSANIDYDNYFIEEFAHQCIQGDDKLLRIYYYDSLLFRGIVTLPVSGVETEFQANERWLHELAKLERFAVREGKLSFRGWRPKFLPIRTHRPLTDDDFAPMFEQKGVDMRIGLDIANFAQQKTVDRIVLVSGDTDVIPAIKQARRAGIEVAIIQLDEPSKPVHDLLQIHADFVRPVEWV